MRTGESFVFLWCIQLNHCSSLFDREQDTREANNALGRIDDFFEVCTLWHTTHALPNSTEKQSNDVAELAKRIPCRPAMDFGTKSFNGQRMEISFGEPVDGCSPIRGSSVRFALIKRGSCAFVKKALNAQNSGSPTIRTRVVSCP